MKTNILMHMADGIISVPVGLLFIIIGVVFIIYALKKVSRDESRIPIMAIMGAFIFVAQMINFTIPLTGSSGHIGGGILLCLVLGPYPAFISLVSVLLIQCLFFGDGGLLAIGCNIFNMGFIPCFIIYPFIVRPLLKKHLSHRRIILASMAGAILSLEAGASMVVIETTLSQISVLPFTMFMSIMLPIHLIIGIVEGIITALVTCYVYREDSSLIESSLDATSLNSEGHNTLIKVLIAMVIIIGAGVSLFASTLPDGLEFSIASLTGSEEIEATGTVKEGLATIQESSSLLPDYHFKDNTSIFGISTSGIVGAALTVFIVSGIGYIVTRKKNE